MERRNRLRENAVELAYSQALKGNSAKLRFSRNTESGESVSHCVECAVLASNGALGAELYGVVSTRETFVFVVPVDELGVFSSLSPRDRIFYDGKELVVAPFGSNHYKRQWANDKRYVLIAATSRSV